jgi:hypothetical protein
MQTLCEFQCVDNFVGMLGFLPVTDPGFSVFTHENIRGEVRFKSYGRVISMRISAT